FLRPAARPPGSAAPAPVLRMLGLIAAAVIAVSIATGHIGFAAFAAERLVSAAIVLGGAYLVIGVVDALFGQRLVAGRPAGLAVAGGLGVAPRTVELAGTLLSAVLRIAVAVAAVLLALGPRGVVAIEVFGSLQDTLLGAGLQSLTFSLGTVLAAAALLAIGLF